MSLKCFIFIYGKAFCHITSLNIIKCEEIYEVVKRKETHKLNVAKMFRKDIDNFRPVEHLRLFQNHSDQEMLV